MNLSWFKPRGYKHFDAQVGLGYAGRVGNAKFVAGHSWLPLIRYIKRIKRYRPKDGTTVFKDRPIMYPSHRDACILTKYAFDLSSILDHHYEAAGLDGNIIAYRKLGKSNADFAAEAYRFASANAPCVVLCFDITGFFDHLNHGILKDRLRRVLSIKELPPDWYAVYRHVTRYSYVDRDDLEANPTYAARLALQTPEPIATIAEIYAAGVQVHRNPDAFGIPQGTPISSAFSNLYMLDVDDEIAKLCHDLGALYQRYSDDILIVCTADHEAAITSALKAAISKHYLEIKEEKTERAVFDPAKPESFQYLGFSIAPDGAVVRPSSLARQWRKAKRSIRRTREVGIAAIASGKASKIYTKKLRRRFSPVGSRNFSSYSRRAGKTFGSQKIVRQVLRLERLVDRELESLKSIKLPANDSK